MKAVITGISGFAGEALQHFSDHRSYELLSLNLLTSTPVREIAEANKVLKFQLM